MDTLLTWGVRAVYAVRRSRSAAAAGVGPR
jgi:hypothetical protein